MNQLNCILLVDDDDTTNFVNQMLLEDLNVAKQVVVANNGWEALQLIRKKLSKGTWPELILIDINMPEMDGFEFMNAYEDVEFEQKESIVIMVLSTSMNQRDLERLQKTPSKGLVNKPLTEEKVNDILNRHFNF